MSNVLLPEVFSNSKTQANSQGPTWNPLEKLKCTSSIYYCIDYQKSEHLNYFITAMDASNDNAEKISLV